MIDVNIVILSYSRADRVLTKNLFDVDKFVICVTESQINEYKKYNPECKFLVHPDSVVGKGATIQWVIENVKNPFFIDDDIIKIERMYTKPGEVKGSITKQMAYEIILNCANMCKEIGGYYYGFSKKNCPFYYKGDYVFSLTGYIAGHSYGILDGSKLYIDKNIKLNDDYFITLLNAYYHRYCFCDNRFYFHQNKTFENRGGLAEFRNIENELKEIEYMQKLFGNVIDITFKNVKLNHIGNKKEILIKNKVNFRKVLKLPFKTKSFLFFNDIS